MTTDLEQDVPTGADTEVNLQLRKNRRSINDADATTGDENAKYRPREITRASVDLAPSLTYGENPAVRGDAQTPTQRLANKAGTATVSGPLSVEMLSTAIEAVFGNTFGDIDTNVVVSAATSTRGDDTLLTISSITTPDSNRPSEGTRLGIIIGGTTHWCTVMKSEPEDSDATWRNVLTLSPKDDDTAVPNAANITAVKYSQVRNGRNRNDVHDVEELERTEQDPDGSWKVTRNLLTGVRFETFEVTVPNGDFITYNLVGQARDDETEQLTSEAETTRTKLEGEYVPNTKAELMSTGDYKDLVIDGDRDNSQILQTATFTFTRNIARANKSGQLAAVTLGKSRFAITGRITVFDQTDDILRRKHRADETVSLMIPFEDEDGNHMNLTVYAAKIITASKPSADEGLRSSTYTFAAGIRDKGDANSMGSVSISSGEDA